MRLYEDGHILRIRIWEVEEPVLADEGAERLPAAAVARRILVVDDNVDVVETTTMLLSLSGHVVHSAKDGLQALHAAAGRQPRRRGGFN